jgi:nicotinamide riboside transporter PnuC
MGGMSAIGQFSWRLLLVATVIGLLIFAAIAACQADTSLFLNVFVVAPALLVGSIASLIYAVIRRRQLWALLATLAALWGMAACVLLRSSAPFRIPGGRQMAHMVP